MGPIGIFGGTFDPIHYGHLRTALELLQRLSLARVLFVPSARQPLRDPSVAPVSTRLSMVRAAVRGESRFAVDTRELERPGPSYTVDTLESLRGDHGQRSLCLLLGMDAFLSLPRWRRWEDLPGLAHIVVAHRPGWQPPGEGPLADLLERCGTQSGAGLQEHRAGRVLVTPVTQIDVSASEIRAFTASGEDPRYLVPGSVRDIIVETECYAR
ncbi:MAG: nicotinate-nucleotide adenylyltransferase [Rhodospirillaceae bacterium]|nr:nicotinate-nucleotide adenylyltransferase [Rhodospirillaceae bacterium]